jgi:hypothetical protein
MNHYIVLAVVGLSAFCGPVAAAPEQSSTTAQESATPDYKNRPDPCEPKQQKQQPAGKNSAGTAKKSSETAKP